MARRGGEVEPLPAPADVVRSADAALRLARRQVRRRRRHDRARCAGVARLFVVAARGACPRAATATYLTTSVSVFCAFAPSASTACTVTRYVPAFRGVPMNRCSLLPEVTPAGRVPPPLHRGR